MEQQGLAADNLELRRHDILSDPLPEGEFDLIHSRLVLEHLPGRLDAMAKMARALAPGGWLVIEEMTFGSEKAAGRRGAALIGGLVQALKVLLRRNGCDATFGRRLPIHYARLGLDEIGAEGTQLVLIGGTPSVEWAKPTFGRIRHMLFDDARVVPRSGTEGLGRPGPAGGGRAPPRPARAAPGRPGVRLPGPDVRQRLGPPAAGPLTVGVIQPGERPGSPLRSDHPVLRRSPCRRRRGPAAPSRAVTRAR